jgi:hypothetical protein
MRFKYLRIIKLVSLFYIFFFFIPFFFEMPRLRSSNVDLERQVDEAYSKNFNNKQRIYFKDNDYDLIEIDV